MSVLVQDGDDRDVLVGADMDQMHLHGVPKEEEEDDDHDDDDYDDDIGQEEDFSLYAINGVLRRRVPVQLLKGVVLAVQDHGTHVGAILHLESTSFSLKRKKNFHWNSKNSHHDIEAVID